MRTDRTGLDAAGRGFQASVPGLAQPGPESCESEGLTQESRGSLGARTKQGLRDGAAPDEFQRPWEGGEKCLEQLRPFRRPCWGLSSDAPPQAISLSYLCRCWAVPLSTVKDKNWLPLPQIPSPSPMGSSGKLLFILQSPALNPFFRALAQFPLPRFLLSTILVHHWVCRLSSSPD